MNLNKDKSLNTNSNINMEKTSICKFFKVGCKFQSSCRFAHNKDELQFQFCKFQDECTNKNCQLIHSNNIPDKNEYFNRLLLQSDVIQIPNKKNYNISKHKFPKNEIHQIDKSEIPKLEEITCWADEYDCNDNNNNNDNKCILLKNIDTSKIKIIELFCKENQIDFSIQ